MVYILLCKKSTTVLKFFNNYCIAFVIRYAFQVFIFYSISPNTAAVKRRKYFNTVSASYFIVLKTMSRCGMDRTCTGIKSNMFT